MLPFFYTNPLRSLSNEFRCTALNNKKLLDRINNDSLANNLIKTIYGGSYNSLSNSEKKKAIKQYEKYNQHLGEYTYQQNAPVDYWPFGKKHQYPENIGIMINENVASSAEQFLLNAKQSSKVKVFGTTSAGALDASNVNLVQSPDKNFILVYCLTRSLRLPEIQIDDVGIKPDYFIDDEIPDYEWINYTNDILNY